MTAQPIWLKNGEILVCLSPTVWLYDSIGGFGTPLLNVQSKEVTQDLSWTSGRTEAPQRGLLVQLRSLALYQRWILKPIGNDGDITDE